MKRKLLFITLLMLFCSAVFGQQHWTMNNQGDYTIPMSVYANVSINGVPIKGANYEMAAFHGEELRGVAIPEYDSLLEQYIVTLTVYGKNNGDEISFKLFDPTIGDDGEELETDFKVGFRNDPVGQPIFPQSIDFYEPYFDFDAPSSVENYMGFGCAVKIDGVEQNRPNLEIAAFKENGEVCGYARSQALVGTNIYIFSLQIYAQNGETISFKLFDPTIGEDGDVLSTDYTIKCNVNYDSEAEIVYIDFKNNAVAKIGNNYYATLEAALAATMDNDVVTIIKSTNETIGVPAGNNVTIKALEGVELSGGAGGSYYNKSVTFDGLTFKGGKGIALTAGVDGITYTVKNCTFDGVQATAWKQGVISLNGNATVVVENNTITDVKNATEGDDRINTYGQQSAGIYTNNAVAVTISGNAITNVDGTGISSNSNAGKVDIKDNNISAWGTGATAKNEGRAIRTSGGTEVAITGNVMIDNGTAKEEFVKATGMTVSFDASENYWSGKNPLEEGIFDTDFAKDPAQIIDNYYTDAAKSNLVELAPSVAKIGDTYYATLEAALNAAQPGETVTILAGDHTADITINKVITVVGERDEQGENLVNITGRVSAHTGATVKNLNVNNTKTGDYDCALNVNGKDIVVDGVKLTGHNAMRYCYASGDITIKNSTINGSNFAVHFDGSEGGNIVFEDTDITGWASYASTVNNVSYTGCYFDQGDYFGHRYYNKNISFTDCTFKDGLLIDLRASGSNVAFTDEDMTVAEVKALFKDPYYVANGNVTLNDVQVTYAASGYTAGVSKYFDNLQDAIDEVNNGGYITVRSNIELTQGVTVPAGKEITLGLNGYTITGTPTEAAAFAVITNNGNLTITDNTEAKEGKILCNHNLAPSTGYAVNTITNNGTLTIEAGTIENKSTYTSSNQIGYAIYNNSTTGNAVVTIKGGKVTASGSTYYDGIRQFCNSTTLENSVTIEGGEVSTLWIQNPSNDNEKDVKGSFDITGGTLGNLYLEPSANFSGSISGGHIDRIARYESGDNDIVSFITGGTFGMDVTEFCAFNYACTQNTDGTYGVNPSTTVNQISNLNELIAFRNAVNAGNSFAGKVVTVKDNIDMSSETNWIPIGTSANPFKGTFDGGDNTISDLNVVDENNVGLFGYATEANIKNVKIVNANVKGTDCVAALIGQGYASTYIDNCHVSGSIKVEGQTNVGGIVGKYYARVTNSSVIGDGVATSYVKGTYKAEDFEGDNIGGIMGHAGENNTHSGNTVKNITISGTRKVGGLIGTTDRATDIDACLVDNVVIGCTAEENYANDKASTTTLGGLVGNYYGESTGGTVTNTVVKNVTFNVGNAKNVGPIVGGNRTTPDAESIVGVTASGNLVYMSTITGSTNTYLMNAVAKIGETKYYTLQEAVDAGNGKTINVIGNTTEAINIADNAVIDLNFSEGVTLNGYFAPFKGNLTINGGTINNENASYSAIEINAGTLVLNDVKVTSKRHGVRIDGAVTATIEGGEYRLSATSGTRHAVNVSGAANVTIKAGTFVGPAGTSMDSGSAVCVQAGAKVTIEGGDFSGGKTATLGVSGTMIVKGGTFDQDPSEYVAEGYLCGFNQETERYEVTMGVASVTQNGSTTYYRTLAEAITAVGSGEVVINLHANATLDYNAREAYGTAETTSLTINGNGKTLTLNQKDSDWSSFGLANADAKVVFNNMIIEKTGYGDTSGAWNTHAIIFSSNVEMTNVTVNNSMAVQDGATLNNVTINEANGYYGLWINGNGQSVTMNGGSINATNGGRGIKIADEYVGDVKQVTLNVTGTTFNTAKKAAVLVSSTAGAAIAASNVDITNVAEDSINFVWVDEEWAAYYSNVKVYDEATKTQENEESFPIKVYKSNINGTVRAYFKNLDELFAAKSTQIPLADNYIELRGNVVANSKVNVSYSNNYYYNFGTSVENGVTMTFNYADKWNMLPHFGLGENITMNVPYLQVIGGDISIAGTLNTGYLYLYGTGEGVVIEGTGVVNANVSNDKTVQVKGGTVLTVKGELNTTTLNVWTQDVNNSKLIVSGTDAQVTASHIHAWNGKDGVSSQEIIVESGALLTAEKLQADRGSIVTVDAATLTATTLTLGYEGNIGTLVVKNDGVITNGIVISSVESTVSGPENLTVTSGVDGYGVNYFNGVYSLVEIEIQETELFKGWNWFSAYVDINGEEGLTKIQNALAGNATLMKSHTAFGTYYNDEWINEGGDGLSSASVTEMYMIQMETAMTGENKMQLEGNLVNPSEHTIQLNQNWNWIGYPSNEPINLENAFNGFTPQNGDRIKSHVGFSQYYGEGSNDFGITGWWGTLKAMTPGLGYMYYRAGGATSFTYNVPADGAKSELRANITADDNYWVPATHRYANNMTMVAMLEGANADNYEVAAFVDGEVRGSARPVYVEPLDAYMFFLTIYGDEVEEMSFRCYDLATGEEYAINDRINYSVDAMLGSIEEPYMFRGTVGIGEATLSEINIYPNPTTTGREISFDATCETVEVFNTLGVKVAEYHYVDTIDAFETAGIYMIRITNNGNVQNCRVVVK